jgi:hypothetical protein
LKKIARRERLSLGISPCRLHGFEPGCRTFAAHANLQAEKSPMTSVITDLARQYRARAEEARARAEVAESEQRRRGLLQIAETWERMARYEEQTNPQRHLWQKKEN